MESLFQLDAGHVLRFVPWLAYAWLEHGFGTRLSEEWNRRPDWVGLDQVHSADCLYADGRVRGRIGQADALVTNVPGAALSVRTADCVPLLLVDPVRRAVAAVHAGWRGTVLGVVSNTVQAMQTRFGSSPDTLEAALGPAVGPCCYRVGPEVATRFQTWFPERNDLRGPAHIDLTEAVRRQLIGAGVTPARIYAAGICTSCRPDLCHSYRRDGQQAGRMVAGVAIREPGRVA